MKKTILAILIIVSLFSLLTFVSAHIGEDEGIHHEGCGMMGGMSGMMTGVYGLGMGIFGWLIGILILVALILLIIWLIKQIQKK
jgi:hypothetical protein